MSWPAEQTAAAEALLLTMQATPHELREPAKSFLLVYTAKVMVEQTIDGRTFRQEHAVTRECVDVIHQSRQIADLVAEALCLVKEGDGRIRGVFVWTSDLTPVQR